MNIFVLLLGMLFVLPSFADQSSTRIQSQSVVAVTVVSTQERPENLAREYLLIQNNGVVNVIVKFGAVQSGSEGIVIPSGGNYEPVKAVKDSIYMKAVSGTQSVIIIEGQ